MASLTIRKLDEAVKAYLRLRSASKGRSVEEEVRVILGELIQDQDQIRDQTRGQAEPAPALPTVQAPARAARPANATGEARVTLIIGGGIA
ncbi:MAG: bifunctional phosphopantothenoylcysteine decarboxylase/phosphopantothenate synthase, partial [Bradyrhizobium sp.]|uniref:FitA-like ribbon-helix-helix domain-containing protein n=1 Tax=Bradyrhizobium sp. TaxID=376 RepID=UPI003C7EC622